MLKLSEIKLNYHGRTALKVDEFLAEESFAVIGCAGSGKSSFLKVIAGLERIESGYIYIDDKEVGELAPKQRSVSLISARTPIKKNKSVYKNLVYPLKKHCYLKAEMSAALTSVLHIIAPIYLTDDERKADSECLGVGSNRGAGADKIDTLKTAADSEDVKRLLSKKVKDLSLEQQTRVLLARALIRKPNIILIDEPSDVVGDIELFCRLLREYSQTFILATYDFSLAEKATDRFAILKGGEIVFFGDREQLAECDNPYITKMCF